MTPNLGEEDNSTTSSNGQSITLPEPNATTTDSAVTKTYRISYKTELGKMTHERDVYKLIAKIETFLLVIIAGAQILKWILS